LCGILPDPQLFALAPVQITGWMLLPLAIRKTPRDLAKCITRQSATMSGNQKIAPAVDRRGFGRRNTFKSATILTTIGDTAQCVVVNLSVGGALLRLRSNLGSLDTFELHIEEDDILVLCRVVHRTDGNVGVQFIRSPRRASRVCQDKSDRMKPFLKSVLSTIR
jgi:hypothetical protein